MGDRGKRALGLAPTEPHKGCLRRRPENELCLHGVAEGEGDPLRFLFVLNPNLPLVWQHEGSDKQGSKLLPYVALPWEARGAGCRTTRRGGGEGLHGEAGGREAPELGEALGFSPRYPSNPRPGARRSDPGRKAENGGRTDAERTFNAAQASLELGVSKWYLRTLGYTGQSGVPRRRHARGQPIYSAMDIRVMKKTGIGGQPRRLRSHSEAVSEVEREQGREEQMRLKRDRREERKRPKEEKREAVRREKRRTQETERPRSWWRRLFGG